MVYQVKNMVRDVRIALDENPSGKALLPELDVETLSLDELIRSKLVEAVRRVEMAAPLHLLEAGHSFGDAVYWGDRESGWVVLPDDFMRLTGFRMSDWERTCHEAVTVEDPVYARQSSRYKGIRGNVQKPVCAVVNRPVGRVLEFYSCNSREAQVVEATYLPYPRIDEHEGIDIAERCYTDAVLAAAEMVRGTFAIDN